ncbi:hypothetical protein GOP47_0029384 [Adiantum capillus-veneris]|nr:hypothetical protein GOP47_0029384 [Adiantum capillus-veneris]
MALDIYSIVNNSCLTMTYATDTAGYCCNSQICLSTQITSVGLCSQKSCALQKELWSQVIKFNENVAQQTSMVCIKAQQACRGCDYEVDLLDQILGLVDEISTGSGSDVSHVRRQTADGVR